MVDSYCLYQAPVEKVSGGEGHLIAQIFRDGPNGRHSTDVKYFLRYETSLLDDLHSRAGKNGVKVVRTGESGAW